MLPPRALGQIFVSPMILRSRVLQSCICKKCWATEVSFLPAQRSRLAWAMFERCCWTCLRTSWPVWPTYNLGHEHSRPYTTMRERQLVYWCILTVRLSVGFVKLWLVSICGQMEQLPQGKVPLSLTPDPRLTVGPEKWLLVIRSLMFLARLAVNCGLFGMNPAMCVLFCQDIPIPP